MVDSPLTPQEVADILKISKSTVYDLIKRRQLNSYRVGKKLRVDLTDVENYKNKTKAKSPSDLIPEANKCIYPTYNKEQFYNNNTFIICGQDVILDILCRFLNKHSAGIRALRSYEGSYNAIYALYKGEVQVATAHMWDSKSGEYNIPYINSMLPGTPAVVIRLASRMQGFYVARGNPKSIKGWDDLLRPDITIVNREKGSGTRILLDEHLRRMKVNSSIINGYGRECQSHIAVASIVARGEADLGIGKEKACNQVQGIDFVPVQKEQYDMIIKKEDLKSPAMEAVISILHSEDFILEVQSLGGYDLTELGKIVAET